MRTLSKHFTACISLFLIGCVPSPLSYNIKGVSGSRALEDIVNGETDTQKIIDDHGKDLGEAEARKLDAQLATAITMKREIEITGRSIKQNFAGNANAQTDGALKYDLATAALDALRRQVRNDFSDKVSEPSAATEQASALLQQRGNDLIAYHGTLTGNRSSALVSVVVEFLGQIYRAWSGFQGAKLDAVLAGVDDRLSPVSWQSL